MVTQMIAAQMTDLYDEDEMEVVEYKVNQKQRDKFALQSLFDQKFANVAPVEVSWEDINFDELNLDDKQLYIVIFEFRPESYRLYLNDQMPAAGGRLINKDFPETQYGAYKLAQKIQEKLKRATIVQIHSNAAVAPKFRDLVEEEKILPEFDQKINEKTNIFRFYLAAAHKKWDATRLGIAIANELKRTWNPNFARGFTAYLNRLHCAVAANEKMQAVCMKFHKKNTLPDIGAVVIPAAKHREVSNAIYNSTEFRQSIVDVPVEMGIGEKFESNPIIVQKVRAEVLKTFGAEGEFDNNYEMKTIKLAGIEEILPVYKVAPVVKQEKNSGAKTVSLANVPNTTRFSFLSTNNLVVQTGWVIRQGTIEENYTVEENGETVDYIFDEDTLILVNGEFKWVPNTMTVSI